MMQPAVHMVRDPLRRSPSGLRYYLTKFGYSSHTQSHLGGHCEIDSDWLLTPNVSLA